MRTLKLGFLPTIVSIFLFTVILPITLLFISQTGVLFPALVLLVYGPFAWSMVRIEERYRGGEGRIMTDTEYAKAIQDYISLINAHGLEATTGPGLRPEVHGSGAQSSSVANMKG